MDNLTPWKTIKIGFFIGIGFVIPTAILDATMIGATMSMAASAFDDEYSEESYEYDAENILADHTNNVEIGSHTVRTQGLQLLIQSTVKNNSEKALNSLTIEAELFDKEGVFVYECSEYISSKLEPGAVENFQVQCGCSKNGLPEYQSIKLKVASATSY